MMTSALLAVLGALLLASCSSGSSSGNDDAQELDLVRRYAPLVLFHPEEEHFPLGVDEFVAHSALRWSHGLCPDETLAPFGSIDQTALGNGGYAATQTSALCRSEGRAYASNEMTRPGEVVSLRPEDLDQGEGFYLDLDDSFRAGDPLVDGRVTTALTYSYKEGSHITYWFMYGFNPGPQGGVTGFITENVARHEGEWERITVHLNDQNEAVAVDYFQHFCDPEPVTWDEMTDADQDNGRLFEGTHPVVYSAWGSHASFKNEVNILYPGVCDKFGFPLQGIGDKTSDGGAEWRTWEVELRNAEESPWHGFGGAWGDIAFMVNGPLGPPHKR